MGPRTEIPSIRLSVYPEFSPEVAARFYEENRIMGFSGSKGPSWAQNEFFQVDEKLKLYLVYLVFLSKYTVACKLKIDLHDFLGKGLF